MDIERGPLDEPVFFSKNSIKCGVHVMYGCKQSLSTVEIWIMNGIFSISNKK